MKPILSILLISLLSTSLLSNEPKNQVQESEKKQTLSEADKKWLEEYIKFEEEGKKIRAELEATKKLNKTADELLKTLGVDK